MHAFCLSCQSFLVKLFCQSQMSIEVSKGKVQPLFCSESLPIQGTRIAIKAKKIQLKKSGLGRRQRAADAITQDEEEMLHKGSITPFDIQFCIFYYSPKGVTSNGGIT